MTALGPTPLPDTVNTFIELLEMHNNPTLIFHWVLLGCLLQTIYRPVNPNRRYHTDVLHSFEYWTWDNPISQDCIFALVEHPELNFSAFCWGHHAFTETEQRTIRLVLFDCFIQHKGQDTVEEYLSDLIRHLKQPPVEAQHVQVTWFDFPDHVYVMGDLEKAAALCQVISAVVYQDTEGFSCFEASVLDPNLPVPSQLPCWESLHGLLPAQVAQERIMKLMEHLHDRSLSLDSISQAGGYVPSPIYIHR